LVELKEVTEWQLKMLAILEQEPFICLLDSSCGMFAARLPEMKRARRSMAARIIADLTYAESAIVATDIVKIAVSEVE